MPFLIPSSVQTMTSREVVAVINSLRPEGKAELRHDSFVAKLLTLKAELGLPNFRDTPYTHPQNGQTYIEYLLDKETSICRVSGENFHSKIFWSQITMPLTYQRVVLH